MTLWSFDMPEDPRDRALWLECHLVGAHLGELIAELQALHDGSRNASAESILEGDLKLVLDRGLTAAPDSRVVALLKNPFALLTLQERVFSDGGSYWSGIQGEGKKVLAEQQAEIIKRMGLSPSPPPLPKKEPVEPARDSAWTRPWFVALATAGILLLAVTLLLPRSSSDSYGWSRPDALARLQNVGEPAYFQRLADLAQEWFDERPANAAALAARIAQFRLGCTLLLLSEHRSLAEEQRTRLDLLCRQWATTLDEQRSALEAGGNTLEVRQRTDALVTKLVRTLRASLKP